MYILTEYIIVDDDSKGNVTSSPVRVLEYSPDLGYFKDIVKNETKFKKQGYIDIGRSYRKKRKILIDLSHNDFKKSKSGVLLSLLRDKALSDLLK